jgi:Glycosyl transferases group 1
MPVSRKLRVLTWHVHGSYLDSLIRTGHDFYLPVKSDGSGGIGGWGWPKTVHEVPETEVRDLGVDLVLSQSVDNLREAPLILSEAQLAGPRIHVEHDPPRTNPTDTRHPVDDPNVVLVHVTAFNDLMWDSGRTPTRVIEHGVSIPDGVRYNGSLERGIVVVNNLRSRGRRLGRDVFERARAEVPLDLVGMDAESLGGLGEVKRDELPAFEARYRFFFHPIRYTSFGMAVCEAMMIGLPIVALATTEMPTVVTDGDAGFVHTDPRRLIEAMQELLQDPGLARRMGERAREIALERFSIERFVRDWNAVLEEVAASRVA